LTTLAQQRDEEYVYYYSIIRMIILYFVNTYVAHSLNL